MISQQIAEPDIKIIDHLISDADQLFNDLRSSIVWDNRMKSRKTASFGVSYNYSGISYA